MKLLHLLTELEGRARVEAKNDSITRRVWREFGKAIRVERRARNMPLKEFAARLGYTPAMAAYIEAGSRTCPLRKAKEAVRILTRPEQWPDAGREPNG